MVSAARDAHKKALLAQSDFSLGGAQITDLPCQTRPLAAALASAPLASTFDSAAAPARALAAPNDALPVSQAALQLAAPSGFSVLSH